MNTKKITYGRKKTTRAKTFKKRVLAIVRPETHNHIISFAPLVNSTGAITYLTNLDDSILSTGYTGSQVRAKRLSLRWRLTNGTTGTVASLEHRIIVFIDRMQDGVIPTVAEVLDATGNPIHSDIQQENQKRFKVLYDSNFAVNATMLPASGLPVFHRVGKIVKRLDHTINYADTGSSGVIADAREGNIFCLTISDIAAGTTAPLLLIEGSLYFTDM